MNLLQGPGLTRQKSGGGGGDLLLIGKTETFLSFRGEQQE